MASILLFSICHGFQSSITHCPRNAIGQLEAVESSKSTNEITSTESQGDWSLEKDWALEDAVQKFSVGDSSSKVVFWSQLSSSTPDLASFTEIQIKERHQRLSGNLPESPQLVQSWEMIDKTQMKGEVNGRTVWFNVQSMGQLLEEETSNNKPRAGGFVEALGGRVYELGQPGNTTPISKEKETNNFLKDITEKIGDNLMAKVGSVVVVAALGIQLIAGGVPADTKASLPSQQPAQTVIVRSSPSVSEMRARTEARVLSEERAVSILKTRLTADQNKFQNLVQAEKEKGQEALVIPEKGPSISEERARTEARVYREQRQIDEIQQRLSQDSNRLKELRAQEK
eukprot:CAMPEP_0194135812 /NCGR_PEP_ID=MMETSP0152-20130528/5894_1 /TAXON_ID=1049557 /ORGANISM="Thalassiothrix antarctica, Strain L6-D1" /LENGTH=341 /DNA_ID=CAMNT_0038832223 /DNA_START=87 /DNA_END=1112 /DNA_ORIENTATION=-